MVKRKWLKDLAGETGWALLPRKRGPKPGDSLIRGYCTFHRNLDKVTVTKTIFMLRVSAKTLQGVLLALVSISAAHAEPKPDQFDVAALDGLCASISTKQRAYDNPNEYAYMFEKKIYAAARVDFKSDNGVSARAKLQALWRKHQRDLRCQAANFNVRDGSILKYALATRTYGLLDNAARVWRLDLNIVDPSDGQTVLDYLESLMPQYAGTNIGTNLENYWAVLSLNGAKHARDLSPAEIAAERAAYSDDVRWHAARGEAGAVAELANICSSKPAACK